MNTKIALLISLLISASACATSASNDGDDMQDPIPGDDDMMPTPPPPPDTSAKKCFWQSAPGQLTVNGAVCPGHAGSAVVVSERCGAAGAFGMVGPDHVGQDVEKGQDGNYVVHFSGSANEECRLTLFRCNVTQNPVSQGSQWSNQLNLPACQGDRYIDADGMVHLEFKTNGDLIPLGNR